MEWNGGVNYWSGVLDWTTGVPRPQNYSISYTYTVVVFLVLHVSMQGYIIAQTLTIMHPEYNENTTWKQH